MIYNMTGNMSIEHYQELKLDSEGRVVAIEPPDWCAGKHLRRTTITIDLVSDEDGPEDVSRLTQAYLAISRSFHSAGSHALDIPETKAWKEWYATRGGNEDETKGRMT